MDKFIVYCTTCTVNSKIYVGTHKLNNDDNKNTYLGCGCYAKFPSSYEKCKTVFQRAVKKYGPDKFIRKTIAEFDNEEDAFALEEEIVNETFLKRNDVYNTCLGGNGGDRGLNAKPCYQYDLDGNFIREFSNRQEAARFVNKGFTTIKRAIKEKIKGGDWYWSGEKVDKLDLSKYKTTTNRIPVFQYSKDGQYDCCYESIADAARCNDTSNSQISKAAKLGTLLKDKYFSFEFDMQFSIAKYEYLYSIPVYLYKISGEYISEFSNLNELKKYLKSKTDLFKYIRLSKPYKDTYQFSFEKLREMPNKLVKKPSRRKIAQYDLDGNFIREFSSVSECVKLYGSGVKHCLTGRNKSSKGYTYKYID